MADPDSEQGGPLAGLRRSADAVLGLVQNRLRLLSLELEGEKLRLQDSLLKLGVALMVCGLGALLGALTLALYVWQKARFGGLVALTAVFLAGGIFLFWRLRQELRNAPRPFEKTLSEFDKDRECLTGKD